MNIISKAIIDKKIDKYDKELFENIDGKYIEKYKNDNDKLAYVLKKIISKDNHTYLSETDLISLLYVYTNEESMISKNFDTYTKNVIKSIIFSELIYRSEFKKIKSVDLYSLLNNLKNEKSFYKQEFEKLFIKTGDLTELKKYYKNKTSKSDKLLHEVLSNNPKQSLDIATQYKSDEDEKILLPISTLQKYVQDSYHPALIISFASNVKNADIKKLEDQICTYDAYYIYCFLINVKNCNKKRLIDELKSKNAYNYLILASCDLNHITGIDFSKLSVENFFTMINYLDIKNKDSLLCSMYEKYNEQLNEKYRYYDKDALSNKMKNNFIKVV